MSDSITIRNPQTGETLEVAQDQFDQVFSGQGYQKLDEKGNVEADKALSDLTRDELNAKASSMGIDSPEGMANKAAVIEAIEQAQAGAEPPQP